MRTNRKAALFTAAALASASLLHVERASAQTYWTGLGADQNWSTGANWDTATPPSTSGNVIFDQNNLTQPLNTVDYSETLGKLTYEQSNSSIDGLGAYVNSYTTTINRGITLGIQFDPVGNTPSPSNANLLVMPELKPTVNGGTGTIVKIQSAAGEGVSKLSITNPAATTGAAFAVSGRPTHSSIEGPNGFAYESFALLDMSELDEFVFDTGVNNFTRSNFGIGVGTALSFDRGAFSGKVILPHNATINGNRLVIGGQDGLGGILNNMPTSLLVLGKDTKINPTLDGGNFYVGSDPNIAAAAPSGAIIFRPGLTALDNPTVTIGDGANNIESGLNVANARNAGGISSTSQVSFGVIDTTTASGTSAGTFNGAFTGPWRIGETYNTTSTTRTGGTYGMINHGKGDLTSTSSIQLSTTRATGHAGYNSAQLNVGLIFTAADFGEGTVTAPTNLIVGNRTQVNGAQVNGIVNLDNNGVITAARVLVGVNSAADHATLNGTVSGIVNLGGGTLLTGQVKGGGDVEAGTKSTRLVNFNGGKLQAQTATTFAANFMENLTGAYVYSGGGTVDTNGENVTINQALLAPTGEGLASVTITDGGAKYRSAPIVVITPDPSETNPDAMGATAVASIDANGVVAGITVTNPGVNYSVAPTVRLVANGGGSVAGSEIPFDGAAATVTPALTTSGQASGGITKTGLGTLTLNGVNTYTGATTADAGTLVLGASSLFSSAMNAAGGDIELVAGGNKVIKTGSLAASGGGKIDLQDNKAIITGQTAAAVSALVATGRGDGTWNGASGIVTSQGNATMANSITTLAVASAADAGKSTFGGQSVSGSDTLVMYTWHGDSNLSGNVDADDYFAIDSGYSKAGAVSGYVNGDFNYDGVIDGDDYQLIDAGFSGQTGVIPAGAVDGVTAVPEPASLSLLAIAAASMLRRRRRQA